MIRSRSRTNQVPATASFLFRSRHSASGGGGSGGRPDRKSARGSSSGGASAAQRAACAEWAGALAGRRLLAGMGLVFLCAAAGCHFDSDARIAHFGLAAATGVQRAGSLNSNLDGNLDGNLNGGGSGGGRRGSFDWTAAKGHLARLCALGPRIVGSRANEEAAPALLVAALAAVQAELSEVAKRRGGARTRCVLEVEVQRPSGAFFTAFLGGFTSSYTQVRRRVPWCALPGGIACHACVAVDLQACLCARWPAAA